MKNQKKVNKNIDFNDLKTFVGTKGDNWVLFFAKDIKTAKEMAKGYVKDFSQVHKKLYEEGIDY